VFLAHPDAAERQRLGDEIAGTGITVIGEAADGQRALTGILDLAPDVALLAVDLPTIDGPDVCRSLRVELPVCRVLLLAHDDDRRAFDGVVAGAYGCYLLGAPPVTLVRAIRGTMRRESLPTPGWAQGVLEGYRRLAAEDDDGDRAVPAPTLTPIELDVLTRLAGGDTPGTIATRDGVTSHIVRLHAGYAIIKLYRAIADEHLVRAAP